MDRPNTIINRHLEYSLRLFGVWPDTSFKLLKTITWTTTILMFLISQCWYCVVHAKQGMVTILDGLTVTLYNSLVLFKLIIIVIHKRTFHKVMFSILEDWNNQRLSIDDKRIINDNTVLSARITKFMYCFYGFGYLAYIGSNLVMLGEDEITHERKFLFKIELPFDINRSPNYEIILAIQMLFELVLVYGSATLILLASTLVLHIGTHIDVLCERLTNVSWSNEKEETRKNAIKECIMKHQKIIILSENVENIFSYLALYQYLSIIILICFLGLAFVVSLHTDETALAIITAFDHYISINCEAFILCYTGEYLISKSRIIPISVYNSLWYDLKPREARLILFIIMRSQKQLTLTAGKFVQLSLETFTDMLKASVSYVSVLYAMY